MIPRPAFLTKGCNGQCLGTSLAFNLSCVALVGPQPELLSSLQAAGRGGLLEKACSSVPREASKLVFPERQIRNCVARGQARKIGRMGRMLHNGISVAL